MMALVNIEETKSVRSRIPRDVAGSLLSPARRWAFSQSGTWVEASARSSNVLAADGSAASRDISRSNASLKRSIHVR